MLKPKIGIYGKMNVGKSSLLNQLIGHEASIVSEHAGTTTDPVRKSFEILDFAPVIFIDTAGYDDSSSLGKERIKKTLATLSEIDMAILVVEGEPSVKDHEFLDKISTPYIIATRNGDNYTVNGSDLSVIEAIKKTIPLRSLIEPPFFGDRINKTDIVILVCPIDSEAPSGRLILPQVQALRAALDANAIAITVQPSELGGILSKITPRLVVTDSQAFGEVSRIVPPGIELTSFSILLSELKGDPVEYKKGIEAIKDLSTGDRVLLLEHCSHQTSCEDIARVKIPRLLEKKLGKSLIVEVMRHIPEDISKYKLIVQCGGCMVGRRSIIWNVEKAKAEKIPITNYGMLLRYLALS